jgi:Na+/melibiose symporter-like transporter
MTLGNDEEIIDVPGAVLLGLTMLGMLYGLITGSTDGWTALPIAVLAPGVPLLIAFAVNQRDSVNPLIRPSLMKNRGFTAGLLLGLFYFAAVNGLAYVASLFLQFALGRSPAQAALGLAPLMVGIIGASIVSRPLIETLGRRLVFIGLTITLIGAAGLWGTVLYGGIGISEWALAHRWLSSVSAWAPASLPSTTSQSAASPPVKPGAPADPSAPCSSSPPPSAPPPSPPSTSPRSGTAEQPTR